MKRIQAWLIFFALYLALSSCATNSNGEKVKQWMKPGDKIKVLSTIAMIDDLVQRIGGDQVDGLVLITGQLDPHSYQLVKGDDEKIAFADLIFYNGLNLEHGPSLRKSLRAKKNALPLGDAVQKDNSGLILHYNGQTDPHIWMDVSIWAATIPYIVKALSDYDPSHAAYYEKNGAALKNELEQLHLQVRKDLIAIPKEKRYLVASHDAFNYFARAYLAEDGEITDGEWQKRFAAPEGLSPDSQLSTVDIQNIVDHLEKYRIQVLFPESNLSRDSINKIVYSGKEKGLDVYIAECPLYGDAMGPPGSEGDSYAKMVAYNAKMIGLYLKDYNPRTPKVL